MYTTDQLFQANSRHPMAKVVTIEELIEFNRKYPHGYAESLLDSQTPEPETD